MLHTPKVVAAPIGGDTPSPAQLVAIKERARAPLHNEGTPGTKRPLRIGDALWSAASPSTFVVRLDEGQVINAAVEDTKLTLTLEYQLDFDQATQPAQLPSDFSWERGLWSMPQGTAIGLSNYSRI